MCHSVVRQLTSKRLLIVQRLLSLNIWLFQELFPANKRSCEHFSKYFSDAGLKELSDFAKNQQSIGARKELQKEIQDQMSRGDPLKDVSPFSLSATFTVIGSFLLHITDEVWRLLSTSPPSVFVSCSEYR